jgi:hypothetical protein
VRGLVVFFKGNYRGISQNSATSKDALLDRLREEAAGLLGISEQAGSPRDLPSPIFAPGKC